MILRSWITPAIAAILRRSPVGIASSTLRMAALAPPAFKGAALEKICNQLAYRLEDHQLVTTNFGISRSIRCEIPLRKVRYAFGNPSNDIAERATVSLTKVLSQDCEHFVDVGAHEGLFLLAAALATQGRVALHWFEPDEALASRLASNLRANSVENFGNIAAVTETTGHATFFKNLSDDSSGSLTEHFQRCHRTRPVTVPTICLSDYFEQKGIDHAIVKIDVEGAGSLVWAGVERCAAKVKYLLMEMLAPEIRDELPLRIIRSTGWRAYYIRDFDLIESREGKFEYIPPFYNWLFCSLPSDALARRLAGTKHRICADACV